MAEGISRVNQHVHGSGHWRRPDGLPASSECSGFNAADPVSNAWSQPRPGKVERAVETDIIPRLVLNRRRDPAHVSASSPENGQTRLEVIQFADLLLGPAAEAAAAAFVAAFRAKGRSFEQVYLDLFQPAARHIGDLWGADLCSFVDVTLALGTLQGMVRAFSPEFQKDAYRFDAGRQALLAPMPGDQHTFGLSIVAEFFRRSAWSVWTAPFETNLELALALRETWFTVVGFSVSLIDQLDKLAGVIEIVRKESCNGDVGILVGGPLFVDHPEYVTQVGADAVGRDARQAVFEAECFATQMAGR